GTDVTILYPVNESLMLRKARDARIVRMAASLAARGHQVVLLVGKSGASRKEIVAYYGIEDLPNLEIVQLPILRKNARWKLSWNGVFYLFALIELIKRSRRGPVDVVYLSVPKLAAFILSWKRWIRAERFVYELHELGIYPENERPTKGEKKVDRLEKRILPRMDAVIVTTEAIRRALKRRFPRTPVETVPLGTTADGAKLPPYFFGPKALYNVCYIGQLYPAQGVDLLVRACARIEQVRLHVIGGQSEEIARLRSLAEESGGGEKTFFHGFVLPHQVHRLIPQMDIFALPSRDTIRMNYVAHIKIYEYLSYGRPIVATRLRSTEEELRDGVNAVLVKPDDPAALAEGIRKLIARPDVARRIAAKGLEAAPSYYWEARAKRIERFILGLPRS
ncbi:MAG TPA: glycosyltransferase family 4 protein, partial [Candidatus Manganitrophaceae bacterium]|nr:glycosyltransferase family 4 protein [Candidatus Manganitrophaceae bacterium]